LNFQFFFSSTSIISYVIYTYFRNEIHHHPRSSLSSFIFSFFLSCSSCSYFILFRLKMKVIFVDFLVVVVVINKLVYYAISIICKTYTYIKNILRWTTIKTDKENLYIYMIYNEKKNIKFKVEFCCIFIIILLNYLKKTYINKRTYV
jgi:hypothetical protein